MHCKERVLLPLLFGGKSIGGGKATEGFGDSEVLQAKWNIRKGKVSPWDQHQAKYTVLLRLQGRARPARSTARQLRPSGFDLRAATLPTMNFALHFSNPSVSIASITHDGLHTASFLHKWPGTSVRP